MLKNIVFDLGNVLVSFRPSEYLAKLNLDKELSERILNDIFRSREWLMLDNGDITTSQAMDAIAAKSSLKRQEIDRIFSLRHEIIEPLPLNVKLLHGLKKEGFRLYFLSNFPADLWEQVTPKYDFFRLFDGGLISAAAHSSKPERKIYEMLLEKYGLIPSECLYIDDLEVNVATAREMGMKGITTYGSQMIGSMVYDALKES